MDTISAFRLVDKHDTATLRWLQAATAPQKDIRRTMQAIGVHEGQVATTNGFALHIIEPVPIPLENLAPGLWLVNNLKTISARFTGLVACERIEEKFPGTDSILDGVVNRKAYGVVRVSKANLIKAVECVPTNDTGLLSITMYAPGASLVVSGSFEDVAASITVPTGVATGHKKALATAYSREQAETPGPTEYAIVCANKDLLLAALRDMPVDDSIVLEFQKASVPFSITGKHNGSTATAIIMPMMYNGQDVADRVEAIEEWRASLVK